MKLSVGNSELESFAVVLGISKLKTNGDSLIVSHGNREFTLGDGTLSINVKCNNPNIAGRLTAELGNGDLSVTLDLN